MNFSYTCRVPFRRVTISERDESGQESDGRCTAASRIKDRSVEGGGRRGIPTGHLDR